MNKSKKTESIVFRLSPEDKKRIEDIAEYNGMSVSSLIIALVHDLDRNGSKLIKYEVKIETPGAR
ncbi:MAG: hypothetical protein V1894_05110, partial [Chloroflexota bacterium]